MTKTRAIILIVVTAAAVVGIGLPLLHQYGQALRSPYSQQQP